MHPYVSQPQWRQCEVLLKQYDPYLLDKFKYEMSNGVERFFLLSFCLACCWPGLGAKSNLRVVRQWNQLQFVFPSEAARNTALRERHYVPGSAVPIALDVNHRTDGRPSRIFVTVPRFDEGRPITLGTVDMSGSIVAYPDYSWHENQGRNCNGMTSVYRIAIDECNRLWVVDSGKIGDAQVCPPQILAFNLANDQLIFRHVVNSSNFIGTTLFITPIVDVRGQGPNDCADTFVYVADVTGFGLLVVDVLRNRSWRVTHRHFYPYPSKGTFTIDGESFDLMDGVFGLALSPYRRGQERYLYFHALASTVENVVRTSTLRNESYIGHPELDANSIVVLPGERPNQSAAQDIDRDGIMYFGLMDPPSIWCWNTATQFLPKNFHQLAMDRETLQFASGLRVVNNVKGEQELWVLTSSFQRVMSGTIGPDRINFRIHAEKIPNLLANSPCKNPQRG